MSTYKNTLSQMFDTMNGFYEKRDTDNVNELAGLFFENTDSPIIIGTCNNEWKIGIDNIRELIGFDWTEWGNLLIDSDSLKCKEYGSIVTFSVHADLEYKYKDDNEPFDSIFEYIDHLQKSEGSSIKKSHEINNMFNRVFDVYNPTKNTCIWNLLISGFMNIDGDDLKCQLMQFAVKRNPEFADVRIDLNDINKTNFSNERGKITEYNHNNGTDCSDKERNMIADEIESKSGKGSVDIIRENIILYNMDGADYFCGAGLITNDDSIEPVRVNGVLGDSDSLIMNYPFNETWDDYFCKHIIKEATK